MKPRSLRRRLQRIIGTVFFILWFIASVGSAFIITSEIDTNNDTRMNQLAHALLQISPHISPMQKHFRETMPETADQDPDEFHAFAVWDPNGTLLIANPEGHLIPRRDTDGYHNTAPPWHDGWRYLYRHDQTNGYSVAVGLRMGEGFVFSLFNALWLQFLFTLVILPVLLIILSGGITRGLRPLYRLTRELQNRDAHSLQPVSEDVPVETLPLVQSLNDLLQRLATAIEREQRFTADAAHELRSPLAALKVQSDALALSRDRAQQDHHLRRIRASIDRASKLIDQLLTLARLDTLHDLPESAPVDWTAIARDTLQSVNLAAREKHIRLQLDTCAAPLPLCGNAALLHTLLRNLLDNAIRYSPAHSRVILRLAPDSITISDHGAGITREHLPRIRERFYRPSGQNASGSGLGLSIAHRIAALHGLDLELRNRAEGGLDACLTPAVSFGKKQI